MTKVDGQCYSITLCKWGKKNLHNADSHNTMVAVATVENHGISRNV